MPTPAGRWRAGTALLFNEPVGADAGNLPAAATFVNHGSPAARIRRTCLRVVRPARVDSRQGNVRWLGFFYCDEIFFAIVADETLYLKADSESADSFRQAGGEPFRFTTRDGRTETMNYWTIPGEALESPVEMQPWERLALAAAVCARKPKKPLARN